MNRLCSVHDFFLSGGNRYGRNLLGSRPPDRRHRPGPDHQGDLLVPVRRHPGRRAVRRRLQPRRRAGHHDQRRLHRRHRRRLERRHLHVPGAAGHHGRAHQRRRRLRRLRPLGRQARPHPHRRPARHLPAGRADLHRRLLQLPDRRLGHAPGHRQPQDLPREAGLHHRRHRRPDLHDRPRLVLGRRRLGHRAGPELRHLRHPAVHPGHPLQLLLPADHRVRHRHLRDGLRLRPHGQGGAARPAGRARRPERGGGAERARRLHLGHADPRDRADRLLRHRHDVRRRLLERRQPHRLLRRHRRLRRPALGLHRRAADHLRLPALPPRHLLQGGLRLHHQGLRRHGPRHADPHLRPDPEEHDRSAGRRRLRGGSRRGRGRGPVLHAARRHLPGGPGPGLLHRHQLGHLRHPDPHRAARLRQQPRPADDRHLRVPGRRRLRRPLLAHLRHDHHGLRRRERQPHRARLHAAALRAHRGGRQLRVLPDRGLRAELGPVPGDRRGPHGRRAVLPAQPPEDRRETPPQTRDVRTPPGGEVFLP